MAKNWDVAQRNEKDFWDSVYALDNQDIATYQKITFESGINFLTKVALRHKLDLNTLSDKTLVDLGCGPYGLVYGLAHLSNLGWIKKCSIIGVDPLMDHYKKYGSFPTCSNLRLLASRGENIDLGSQSADLIISSNVIDHVEDPQAVISEVKRVLKPGGSFFVSSHVVKKMFTYSAPVFKYIDKNHPHHFSETSLIALLKRNFDNIEISYKASIVEDQPDFTISRIMKSYSFLRGIKRVASNYILESLYLNCS